LTQSRKNVVYPERRPIPKVYQWLGIALIGVGRCGAQTDTPIPPTTAASTGSNQEDPNFPRAIADTDLPSAAASPIWPTTGSLARTGLPLDLLFAKDHSLGFYVGYNAQGSWIRHESGVVYVFNRARNTLTIGAKSLAQVPGNVIPPQYSDTQNFPRRVSGMITRDSSGSVLTYDLLEQGKPARKMRFNGLAPGPAMGIWEWIGDPSQADPVALGQLSADERQRLQLGAPGEAPGSAAGVKLDSSGNVEWQFATRIFTAAYFAHGEHGRLTPNSDGTAELSFTLHVPGKAEQPLALAVTRARLIMNPVLENSMFAGTVILGNGCGVGPASGLAGGVVLNEPLQLDPKEAWIWLDSNGQVPLALAFNIRTDGWVQWTLVSQASARVFSGGPTPADWMRNPATEGHRSSAGSSPAAPMDDPNLPKASAPMNPPYRTPVVWRYSDSTIPSVWCTSPVVFNTVGRVPHGELVYLGFNQRGSWFETADGSAIYTWNGTSQELTLSAHNMSEVPTDLSNPSDFMRRYWARDDTALQGTGTSGSEKKNGVSVVNPLQAAGFIPGDTGPSSFSAAVGSSGGGTGARIRNGVLTYKDSQGGAEVTMKVRRPRFITAQATTSLGDSGMWVWVSEDQQKARVINVDRDGSVKITVVPVQTATSMLPP
jgi:hypothetical protein